MIKPINIQYPVGQGGLHLGVVDDVAYIYDCGGWGKSTNVNWGNILTDVANRVRFCESIHIYISHFHSDHCNKLDALLDKLSHVYGTRIKFHYPKITAIQKIMLILDFTYDDNSKQETSYDEYYDLVSNTDGYVKDKKRDFNIDTAAIPIIRGEKINYKDESNEFKRFPRCKGSAATVFFLDAYSILHNSSKIGEFRKLLKTRHWNNEDKLLEDIRSKGSTLRELRRFYEKSVGMSHGTMLCLYAGYDDSERYGWLHTGDIALSRIHERGFYKHYQKYLSRKNYIQVPHHGSKHNHDHTFNILKANCNTKFFLTRQKNPSLRAHKHVKPDLTRIHHSVKEVEENAHSRIAI